MLNYAHKQLQGHLNTHCTCAVIPLGDLVGAVADVFY